MFPKSENPQGFTFSVITLCTWLALFFAVCHSGKELLCDMWFSDYVMQDFSYYE